MTLDPPAAFDPTPDPRLPSERDTFVRLPGLDWLVGWIVLFWLGMTVALRLSGLFLMVPRPDPDSIRGVAFDPQWIWTFGRYSVLEALRVALTHAFWGLAIGTVAFLRLRGHVAHARWLPVLGLVGVVAGTFSGEIVAVLVGVMSGVRGLRLDDLDLIRHIFIRETFGGVGLALGLGYVVRRELPGHGWWVAAIAVGVAIWSSTSLAATNVASDSLGLILFIFGWVLTAVLSGGSLVLLLRLRARKWNLSAEAVREAGGDLLAGAGERVPTMTSAEAGPKHGRRIQWWVWTIIGFGALSLVLIIIIIGTRGGSQAAEHHNRGVELSDSGQFDAAIVEYTQAIELDPGYADAYSNRGLVYWSLGDLEQAIRDLDRAIQLDPVTPAHTSGARECTATSRISSRRSRTLTGISSSYRNARLPTTTVDSCTGASGISNKPLETSTGRSSSTRIPRRSTTTADSRTRALGI